MDKEYRRAFKGRSIGDFWSIQLCALRLYLLSSTTRFMRSIYSAGEGPQETDIVGTMLSKLNRTL
jgi:hypothetical protein